MRITIYFLLCLGILGVGLFFIPILSTTASSVSEESSDFIIGNVTKVVDGDTLDIETGDRIRLAIINTPERGQDGYQEAKQYTKDKCLGKDAIIDLDDSQPRTYGRLVGVVYCDAYFINLGLLQNDLAVVMPQFCKISEFKDGVLCQYQAE